MLVRLIDDYEMGPLYATGFPGLWKCFFIHEQLFSLWLPRLSDHFVCPSLFIIFIFILIFIFIFIFKFRSRSQTRDETGKAGGSAVNVRNAMVHDGVLLIVAVSIRVEDLGLVHVRGNKSPLQDLPRHPEDPPEGTPQGRL